jgi:hypothetical protein
VSYVGPQVQLALTHSRIHRLSCGASHVSAIVEGQDSGIPKLYQWYVWFRFNLKDENAVNNLLKEKKLGVMVGWERRSGGRGGA